jgi:AraC-like DNA-binding protein
VGAGFQGASAARDLSGVFRHTRAVHGWRVHFDPKLGRKQHQLNWDGHSLLSPIVSQVFADLHISASVWEHGYEWMGLHSVANPLAEFETEFGKEAERRRYNERSFKRVLAERRTLRGELLGWCDLFVPILRGGEALGVLVTGPFSRARPTARDVAERWKKLSGHVADPADPAFGLYLSASLSALVLEGEALNAFQQLVECTATLMAGEGKADALANRAEVLMGKLEPVRRVERSWELVQGLIDERSAHAGLSLMHDTERRRAGLSRPADSVLVGLTLRRNTALDPIEEAVNRHELQRRSVDLARRYDDTSAGRVGEHGVVFVCSARGPALRTKQRLTELSQQVSGLAKREFGLSLCCGASVGKRAQPLSRVYQAALGAAELSLSREGKLHWGGEETQKTTPLLSELRRGLTRFAVEQPGAGRARFDRYLEAVASRAGHRLELVRVELEAGFDCLTAPLSANGILDQRSVDDLYRALERAGGEARTPAELFAAYRRAVADVFASIENPVEAQRDRGLRRALEHIRQHFTEPLSRAKVARIAGLSPVYFSKLFKQRERVSFAAYVVALRLERAKHLLSNTGLEVARIAELSGFRSSQYFCQVFQRQCRKSPLAFRRAAAPRAPTVARPNQTTKTQSIRSKS